MATKEMFVVAGPNGAGKTTFAEEFLSQHECAYISADAIASELNPDDPTSARVTAGRVFLDRVQSQLSDSCDFVVETTLSGRTFRHIVHQARAVGYHVTILLIYLD